MRAPLRPEDAFQKDVYDLAKMRGWTVAHFRSVYDGNAKRWLTPVSADGKGFPDLVLVRERIIFAELKAKTGRLRPEQVVWIDKLRAAGSTVFVWKPVDLDDISKELNRRGPV